MSRTSHPTNVMVRIKGYPLFSIFFADELHTIVANKDGRCSSYNQEEAIELLVTLELKDWVATV